MPKGKSIENNKISIKDITVDATDFVPDIAVLRSIRESKAKDKDGNPVGQVDCIRYDCIDTETYQRFTIKVQGSRPIISKEDLESSTAPIFIEIPVEDVVIRPYSIEYGKANVSIIAPYVTLVKK